MSVIVNSIGGNTIHCISCGVTTCVRSCHASRIELEMNGIHGMQAFIGSSFMYGL